MPSKLKSVSIAITSLLVVAYFLGSPGLSQNREEVVGDKRTIASRHRHYSFPRPAKHPVYYTPDEIERARRRVKETEWGRQFLASVRSVDSAPVMALSEKDLVGRLSEQVGFYLPMDPVTRTRTSYMDQYWEWRESDPGHIRSKTSGLVFPNPDYPMDKVLKVVSPTGKVQEYPYYEDKEGIRYFFDAYCRKLAQGAVVYSLPTLAQAYILTGDQRYARRAALLLRRLAEVYPEWPTHGPGKTYGVAGPRGYEEKFFSANPPYPYVSGRVREWYLSDLKLASDAALAYDLIYDSGELERLSQEAGYDVRERIERDLIYEAVEFGLEFVPDLHNPAGYNATSLATVGLVFDDPNLIAAAAAQYRAALDNCFNSDGMWHEGTFSYYAMVLNGMLDFPEVIRSYVEMRRPGKLVEDRLSDVYRNYPQLRRIYTAGDAFFLPNGYATAINDTHALDHRSAARAFKERAYVNYGGEYLAPQASEYSVFRRPDSTLAQPHGSNIPGWESAVLPETGFVFLRTGAGADRSQVYFDYGRFSGHQHRDALQIALFAKGYDLSPDIGYTYTRLRPFTDSTASHNTVIVDGVGQALGYGELTGLFTSPVGGGRESIQYAEASAAPVYARQGVSVYERAVAMIPVSATDFYVFDVFRVKGGRTHDWLLHGAADYRQQLHTNVPLKPIRGNLQEWVGGGEATTSMEAGHDFFRREDADPREVEKEMERIRRESGYDFIKKLEVGETDGDINLSFDFETPIARPKWGYAYSTSPPTEPAFEITQAENARLRTTLLGQPGTQLIRGAAPGIRRAGERDENLEDAYMPIAVARRKATEKLTQFVAVHEPYAGNRFIHRVTKLRADDGQGFVAVKIEHKAGTDFLLASAKPEATFQIPLREGANITFSGRFGFLRLVNGAAPQTFVAEGARLSLENDVTGSAEKSQRGNPISPRSFISNPTSKLVGRIVAIKEDCAPDEIYLDIDRVWPRQSAFAGSILSAQHKDGSRTAYKIDRVEARDGGDRIYLKDTIGLALSRGKVTRVSKSTITSDVQHPKGFYDAWYRGKTLVVGTQEFTISRVHNGRHFEVKEAGKLSTVRPGALLKVVATQVGDAVEVPINTYLVHDAPEQSLDAMLDRELPSLLDTYRTLHANPELPYQEKNTAALMAGRLRYFGYDVTEGVGKYSRPDLIGHGVVAVLKNGRGPVIMLRTELDALPLEEKTDLPYASKVMAIYEGEPVKVMHACGHDLHIVSLLGAAKILAQLKDRWRGTLILVGQPAEEVGGGASAMLRDGLYTRFPKPDYALAFHNHSALEAGKILYFEGYARANVDSVDITVRGLGGHGAAPQTTRDPTVLAAQIILALQTIVSRENPPLEPAVISVGSVRGGNKRNIIPDEVRLQLSIRTQSDEGRRRILASIKRITDGLAHAAGMPADRMPVVKGIEEESAPAIYNDPNLSARLAGVWEKTFGADQVALARPLMSTDDFARFALEGRQIPLCMFAVGAVDPAQIKKSLEQGALLPSHHSSLFAPLPEPTIRAGVKALTVAVLELMGK